MYTDLINIFWKN